MKIYKHKTQRTRNAQLTYYSIIKNLLKSILFRDERKQENGSHHCPVEDCSIHLQHDMQRNVS